MIKDIIEYPMPLGVEYAPDVRVFDEELYTFIDDLKETVKENNLEGLSATQVGSYYNVVVVKNGDDYLELINPRVIKKKGEVSTVESTSYFPQATVEIKRYEEISLVYEDRAGDAHSLKADGDFGILLQRKIDYLYGGTLLNKLSEREREKFEAKLKGLVVESGVACPTTPRKFSRDYFIKTSNYLMIFMTLFLGASLFISDDTTLHGMWDYQLYFSYTVLGLNIAYTLYSYYENKRFSVCTNCYNMSIFGVVVITLVRLSIVMILSYFLINPS